MDQIESSVRTQSTIIESLDTVKFITYKHVQLSLNFLVGLWMNHAILINMTLWGILNKSFSVSSNSQNSLNYSPSIFNPCRPDHNFLRRNYAIVDAYFIQL